MQSVLHNHVVYFVGVFCDLATMQMREILRCDRAIGLANDQIDRVHVGLREYDLNVDTSTASPFETATQILTFVESTHTPQGFINMQKKFK
ncbi:phosphotransferase-like protein [Candidatus Trichorickettsia mobilis]|uniref:phosphotransferase-like protein n=1 Tax=Candidatus Trichorickettsia mobilis TaxID=1346319 RepID=UPI0037433067